MSRSFRFVRPFAGGAALLLGLASCSPITDPVAKAELQTALEEIRDAAFDARDEVAVLEYRVDSLRGVVARQDTLIRQLANLTGVRVR